MFRTPSSKYLDPLDAIWLTTAHRIGFRVVRSREVFAASDGSGVLTIGAPDTLDADDCLAQMILHEFCHALVEGPHKREEPDWGLDNLSTRDIAREHACLRLQASLTDRAGLRDVLKPTTEFRAFYEALPANPLEPIDDASVRAAVQGAARADKPPWAPHLAQALSATAKVFEVTRELGATDPDDKRPPIWG